MATINLPLEPFDVPDSVRVRLPINGKSVEGIIRKPGEMSPPTVQWLPLTALSYEAVSQLCDEFKTAVLNNHVRGQGPISKRMVAGDDENWNWIEPGSQEALNRR